MAPVDCFLRYVNSNPCNLKFTGIWDDCFINFLDITLTGDVGKGKVITSLYRKPSAGNTLLRANSCHPQHTILAVPKGEFIRAKRACTLNEDFDKEAITIRKRLMDRGYKNWIINKAEKEVRLKSRDSMLFESGTKKSDTGFVFSTPYSSSFKDIKKLVHKNLPILHYDEKLSKILSKGVRVVSKRNKTVGNFIPPSLFSEVPKAKSWLSLQGFYQCNGARCNMCNYAKKNKFFPIDASKKQNQIKTFLNCDSKYAVYIIQCMDCNLLYIGCTIRKIKTRISEHRAAIAKGHIHHSGAVAHNSASG